MRETHLGCIPTAALQTFAKPSNVRLMKSFEPAMKVVGLPVDAANQRLRGRAWVWARLYHLGFPPVSCGTRSTSRPWQTSTCKASTSSTFIRPLESSSSPLASRCWAMSLWGGGSCPLIWPGSLAARRLPRLVLPQREGRRHAGHLLRRRDDIHSPFQNRGYGHFCRFPCSLPFLRRWAESNRQVIFTSVLLGLAVAVKWAAFPVAVPIGYILWRKGLLRSFLGDSGSPLSCTSPWSTSGRSLPSPRTPYKLGFGRGTGTSMPRARSPPPSPTPGLALVELADHAAADTLFLRDERGGTLSGSSCDRQPLDLVE